VRLKKSRATYREPFLLSQIKQNRRHIVICPFLAKGFFQNAAGFVVLLLFSAVVMLTGQNFVGFLWGGMGGDRLLAVNVQEG